MREQQSDKTIIDAVLVVSAPLNCKDTEVATLHDSWDTRYTYIYFEATENDSCAVGLSENSEICGPASGLWKSSGASYRRELLKEVKRHLKMDSSAIIAPLCYT